MSKEDLDARLVAYLHSVPPEAQDELLVAIRIAAAAQRKGSWLRAIVIAGAALVGSGWSANAYLSRLVTRDYIEAIESARRVRDDERSHLEETQNARLGQLESQSSTNKECCNTQQGRLDRLLTPGRISP